MLIAVPFLFSVHSYSQQLTLKNNTSKKNNASKNNASGLNPFRTIIQYDTLLTDTNTVKSDSTFTTVKPKTITSQKFRMKKSPTTAVLLSAVLPGAGQFYNQSYWKIPIVAALVGYFGYEYFRQNNLYKDKRDEYIATQTPSNPNGDLNLKALREFYRGQRDDFVWYFTIVYVINLVDAYIDAHLFDFDVKEEKMSEYGPINRTYKLNFNLKF